MGVIASVIARMLFRGLLDRAHARDARHRAEWHQMDENARAEAIHRDRVKLAIIAVVILVLATLNVVVPWFT